MALGSTHPLTEMGEGDQCVGLIPTLCLPTVWKLWEPHPPEDLRTRPGLYRERYVILIGKNIRPTISRPFRLTI